MCLRWCYCAGSVIVVGLIFCKFLFHSTLCVLRVVVDCRVWVLVYEEKRRFSPQNAVSLTELLCGAGLALLDFRPVSRARACGLPIVELVKELPEWCRNTKL